MFDLVDGDELSLLPPQLFTQPLSEGPLKRIYISLETLILLSEPHNLLLQPTSTASIIPIHTGIVVRARTTVVFGVSRTQNIGLWRCRVEGEAWPRSRGRTYLR
jgi:hypothetical protein